MTQEDDKPQTIEEMFGISKFEGDIIRARVKVAAAIRQEIDKIDLSDTRIQKILGISDEQLDRIKTAHSEFTVVAMTNKLKALKIFKGKNS